MARRRSGYRDSADARRLLMSAINGKHGRMTNGLHMKFGDLLQMADRLGVLPMPSGISRKQRYRYVLDNLRGTPIVSARRPSTKTPKKPVDTRDPIKAFYASYDWRKTRMEVLKLHGRRCQCCGATPDHGVVIHVDHIKPLRFFWDLRLDLANLQVLCEVCNHGKGNWDRTDWRQNP